MLVAVHMHQLSSQGRADRQSSLLHCFSPVLSPQPRTRKKSRIGNANPQINRQDAGSAILVCTKAAESPKIHSACAVITSPTLILEEKDTDVQKQLTSGA